jgi:NADH-quinone oxidoreductase subunit A
MSPLPTITGKVCESFHKVPVEWISTHRRPGLRHTECACYSRVGRPDEEGPKDFERGFATLANYLPILIYLVAVIGFAAVSLILPHLVAPKKHTRVKEMPYESGMDPVGDARKPFDVKFYLMAIMFLVFDVELMFLYPWAVSLLAPDGVPTDFRPLVFAVMMFFLITLVLAYLVDYCKGVFDWRRK